jgi:hypothetical protein
MGDNLSLTAEFPDRPPIVLAGISEDDASPPPRKRKSSHR